LMDGFHAEMVACLHGIMEAVDQGMSRVILETDSMMAKLALESNSFGLAPTGGIVYEIKSLISSNFSDFMVLYSPRECNRVAHA
ncbi:hypothetical protein BAE44_0002799, partial [Dichanthelium oligosanthes]